MRLLIGYILFIPRMWRVIRSDHIQPVVQQGLPQCLSIMWGLNGRVAFDPVTQSCIIIAGEMQVVHANFRCDAFFLQRKQVAE